MTSGNVTAVNNTIAHNTATERAGGATFAGGPGDVLKIYNNIIWGNSAPSGEGGDILLYCSGWFVGYHNDYSDLLGAWSDSGNNIDEDPHFIGAGDYHLQFSSPCRNAGDPGAPHLPAVDYDGQKRILGTAPDMGADETFDFSNLKGLKKIIKIPSRLKGLWK